MFHFQLFSVYTNILNVFESWKVLVIISAFLTSEVMDYASEKVNGATLPHSCSPGGVFFSVLHSPWGPGTHAMVSLQRDSPEDRVPEPTSPYQYHTATR